MSTQIKNHHQQTGSEDERGSDIEAQQQQHQPVRRRSSKANRQGQRRKGSATDSHALDTITNTAEGLAEGTEDSLGSVAGSALDNGVLDQKHGDKSDTLRLRLDLNLDVEITLKARIHGDLELALLN